MECIKEGIDEDAAEQNCYSIAPVVCVAREISHSVTTSSSFCLPTTHPVTRRFLPSASRVVCNTRTSPACAGCACACATCLDTAVTLPLPWVVVSGSWFDSLDGLKRRGADGPRGPLSEARVGVDDRSPSSATVTSTTTATCATVRNGPLTRTHRVQEKGDM